MLQCGISFQWEIRGGQLNRPIYMWKSSLAAATIRHWASTALLLTWNFNEFENKGDFKFKVTLWSVWAAVFPCSFEDAHWNYCIAVPCLNSRLSVFWDRWSSQKSKISMQRSSSYIAVVISAQIKSGSDQFETAACLASGFNDWLVPFPSAAYRCQYIQSLKCVC